MKKKTEIIKAIFKAKTRIILEIGVSKDFNYCCMTIEAESIMVVPKN